MNLQHFRIVFKTGSADLSMIMETITFNISLYSKVGANKEIYIQISLESKPANLKQ